ncbi:hypothetical protein CC80DRAFT_488005 [Byssothecium circinans]|uniref:Uncharacterized protein n=1 Tax=Byssothecium circinans TaxID=147558 RepID=A0A6A5UBN6_9PLEO|nr:hypothetical protein CC80DRAFT_488005 [Byssothecium circinans]
MSPAPSKHPSSSSTRSSPSAAQPSSSRTSSTSAHHYLSPSQISTISTWASSLPKKHSKPRYAADDKPSRDSTIEAYERLRLAFLIKARENRNIQNDHSPS